jgi:hypothetical protein
MSQLDKEQELLRKLYECQDYMEKTIESNKDIQYVMLCSELNDLIKRLEFYICNCQELM